jgi:hypothetical protein
VRWVTGASGLYRREQGSADVLAVDQDQWWSWQSNQDIFGACSHPGSCNMVLKTPLHRLRVHRRRSPRGGGRSCTTCQTCHLWASQPRWAEDQSVAGWAAGDRAHSSSCFQVQPALGVDCTGPPLTDRVTSEELK